MPTRADREVWGSVCESWAMATRSVQICRCSLSRVPLSAGGRGERVETSPTLFLLHVGADYAIPLLGDDLLGRPLFVERREHGHIIGGGRRQLVQEFLRDLAVLRQVLETDRMAISLQPADL